MQKLDATSKNDRMILACFQGKALTISVLQVCAPTTDANKAEADQFYEDIQHLLELTPKKDVLFIIGDWNAKVESQEISRITGKFGFGVHNEAVQRQTEFWHMNITVQLKCKLLLSWISICSPHQLDIEPSLGLSLFIYKKSWLNNSSLRPILAKILLVSSMYMLVNSLSSICVFLSKFTKLKIGVKRGLWSCQRAEIKWWKI